MLDENKRSIFVFQRSTYDTKNNIQASLWIQDNSTFKSTFKLILGNSAMSEKQQQCQVDRCDNAFVVIFFKTMYNKTIIRFGFCDIWNNQGLG